MLEPVAQYGEQTVHVARVIERRDELPDRIDLVRVRKPLPRLRLRRLNKGDQRIDEKSPLRVVNV